MAKKILITGAGGQLGRVLHLILCDKFDIFATSRSPSSSGIYTTNNKLDITNRIEVKDVIRSIKPNVIINCAAFTNVDGCEIYKHQDFTILPSNALLPATWVNSDGFLMTMPYKTKTDAIFAAVLLKKE